MAAVEIALAGAVSLRHGGRTCTEAALPGRQLKIVTAMLVLERRHPVTYDVLADQVWPRTLPDRWRPALRLLVSKVRRAFVDLGLPPETITAVDMAYRVRLDDVSVDLEAAMDAAGRARSVLEEDRVEDARDLANQSRAVLSRPVLPGVDTPWLDGVRTRAQDRLVDALVVLGTCRSRLDRHDEARAVLGEAVDQASVREDAWRALMRAEARAGNAAGALDVYERCRRHLADELGVDPSAATQQVHGEVLAAIPDPDAVGPSPRVEVTAPSPELDRAPYVGLRAFHADESALFFGRSAEVQELVARLDEHGIVAVVGPSGIGKSSLVRAGLLPALHHGALPDSDTWPWLVVTPGTTPIKCLASELAARSDDLDDATVASRLTDDPDGLHEVATHLLADHEPSARLVLVIDQLEEAFTLGDDRQAEVLVAQLVAATRRADARVLVVTTLRADFFTVASRVPGMADLLSRVPWVVPPLTGEQVEEVVVAPARRAGLQLEPGLLARVLTDMAGQPGALPLLQHLLRELWERRVGDVLTRGAYDDLGGVPGALANRAELVYDDLDMHDRAHARRILLRAVQPGEDGSDARRPVRASEWAGPGSDGDRVEVVVARLVEARLLHAGQSSQGDEGQVELAHEALIDGWPRLRAWVDEARRWLLDHRRLTTAAADWERHDRHEDWLLAGLPLDEAHELLLADGRGDIDLHLSPREHDLVTASLAAREDRRVAEVERRAHERRLERRSLRRTQALVALVALVAVAVGAMWWMGRREARAAEIGRLVASSNEAVDDDPQLAMLLALEASERVGTGDSALHHEVTGALRDAVAANTVVERFDDVGGVLAFSGDRAWFATARDAPEPDGTWAVDVRSVETGGVVATLVGHGGDGPPVLADFGRRDVQLAVATRAGVAHVWDWVDEYEAVKVEEPNRRTLPRSLDLSDDGGHVAVGSERAQAVGQLRVWRLANEYQGELVARDAWIAGSDPASGSVVFHPTQPRVAIVVDGQVQVRDSASGDVTWTVDAPGSSALAWSPDGAWLAAVGTRLDVWAAPSGDAAVGVALPTRAGHVTWNRDSTRVATAPGLRGPPGHVLAWEVVTDAGPVAEPAPPRPLAGAPASCVVAVFGPPDTLFEALPCDGDLRRHDFGPGGPTALSPLPRDDSADATAVAFAPDGTTLATSTAGGDLALWSTASWERERLLPVLGLSDMTGGMEGIRDVAWAGDASRLALVNHADVGVWDTQTWTRAVRVPNARPGPVAMTPDGDHTARANDVVVDQEAAPGGVDDLVRVVDGQGREAAVLQAGVNLQVESLAFSPAGDLLAAALADPRGVDTAGDGVAIWDWRREDLVAALETDGPATAVAWTSAGTRLLVSTARPGNAIETWDLAQVWDRDRQPDGVARRVGTMAGHTASVHDLAVTRDGRVAASCSADGTVRLWAAGAGDELQVVTSAGVTENCRIDLDTDGTLLAVSDPTSDVRLFPLGLAEVAAQAEAGLVRGLTTRECREHDVACPD